MEDSPVDYRVSGGGDAPTQESLRILHDHLRCAAIESVGRDFFGVEAVAKGASVLIYSATLHAVPDTDPKDRDTMHSATLSVDTLKQAELAGSEHRLWYNRNSDQFELRSRRPVNDATVRQWIADMDASHASEEVRYSTSP